MSIDRFLRKTASLGSIFPAVAGPAVGGFAGRAIGQRLGGPEVGMLLGGITGGTAGQLIKEKVEDAASAPSVPPGAPYALDATMPDIPPWAIQGAQLLQPAMKQAEEHESTADVLLGEVPGGQPILESIKHGPRAGLRALGGVIGGGVPAGLLGVGAAHGIEHLVGHPLRVPGINLSLSDVLGSIGGALGATKGLRYMQS
jgi:hypothetical protein